MADKKEKKITCDVIKIFDEKETHRGKTRIQIVSWNNYSPVLEKRDFWEDKEGNEKMGKAKGFNIEDFSVISENMDEIEKLLDKDK